MSVRDNGPANVTAEKAVIGAILRSPDSYWSIAEGLRADQFADALHRDIFGAIQAAAIEGKKPTMTLVRARLPDTAADGADMAAHLAVLVKGAEDVETPREFVELVIDCAKRRAAITTWEKGLKAARDPSSSIDDVISDASSRLGDIASATREYSIGEILTETMNMAASAYKQEFSAGFTTGLAGLDEILGVTRPGYLCFLGAGEKVGKTALAMQISFRAAETMPVLWFQADMPRYEMGARALAARTAISASTILAGEFELGDYDILLDMQKKLVAEKKVRVIDTRRPIKIGQLAGYARASRAKHGLGLMVVDHLLKVKPDRSYENEFAGIASVTEGLKALALDLNCAVLVMTHRTRGSQDRNDPKPYATDFFGGGSIERDCDWLLGIYSKEKWLRMRKPSDDKAIGKWRADLEMCRGQLQAIILAHRHMDFPEERTFRWNGTAQRVEESGGRT